jgi:hypothetical protein
MTRRLVEFGFRGKGAKFRGRGADGRRQRLQGVLGSFAHEFHATVNLVFGKQGRDVKFDGALRQIEFVGNFLVGKTAKDAFEDFFLAAGKLNEVSGPFRLAPLPSPVQPEP